MIVCWCVHLCFLIFGCNARMDMGSSTAPLAESRANAFLEAQITESQAAAEGSASSAAASLREFSPLPWNESHEKARSLLGKMTQEEKVSLMRGIGWTYIFTNKGWYIGNTPAITRLQIPSLNMQDAAGGFRTMWEEVVGTVTCWPSLLAFAATWDPALVNRFTKAMALEFAGKGANVLLGPSINVHRSAWGGRNFEYLSAEDPYLGARLAEQYVQGVQSQGVVAVMKHFALNQQETNRQSESSDLPDEKTKWELYYPAFEASVAAGVSMAMCSYNRVNGVYACSNRKLLRDDLKGTMGFQGMVQSDWWATYATSVDAGLDQSMPGTDQTWPGVEQSWFSPESLLCKKGTVLQSINRVTLTLGALGAAVALGVLSLGFVRGRKRRRRMRDSSNIQLQLREADMNSDAGSETVGRGEQPLTPDVLRIGTVTCPERPVVICLTAGLFFVAMGAIVMSVSEWPCAAPSTKVLDEAVERILAVMYRMDLFNNTKCSPPHCDNWLYKNVTSEANSALAREAATESIVLLKNERNTLPLGADPKVRTIGVVGSPAAAAPIVAFEDQMLNHFLAHLALAGAAALVIFIGTSVLLCKTGRTRCRKIFIISIGLLLALGALVVPFFLALQAYADVALGDYYSGGGSGHVIAGTVVTPLQGIEAHARNAGMEVLVSLSDDVSDAVNVAQNSDVTVVVAATRSGETFDRTSLHLDNDADDLIQAVASNAQRTVVIMQIPGAVVMPWRDAVACIAVMFLGGQETGSAWGDILFGSRAPAGRLPIMIPETEDDTIKIGTDLRVPYEEGLATSYRSPFKAAFPFGYGLTYTVFAYKDAKQRQCGEAVCIDVKISNTGKAEAGTTAQLYLELPSNANEPAPLLKGFNKTGLLKPGENTSVTFRLLERDVSYYESGRWVRADSAIAHIGESSDSKDYRQNLKLRFSSTRSSGIGLFLADVDATEFVV